MTLKFIHRFQTFSNAIHRTFVQHFTWFQLTLCSHGFCALAELLVTSHYEPFTYYITQKSSFWTTYPPYITLYNIFLTLPYYNRHDPLSPSPLKHHLLVPVTKTLHTQKLKHYSLLNVIVTICHRSVKVQIMYRSFTASVTFTDVIN